MPAERPRKKVVQESKIQTEFELKELPWTEKQKQFIELATCKKTKMILVKGVAGTSKTALSMYCSLRLLLQKRVSKIVLVRNLVESSDNKLGFLPGSQDEKIYPYMIPFFDKLDMFLHKPDNAFLQKEKRIEAFPVGFLRGMDFNVKAIICDESQNMSKRELLTLMTRIGEFCKTFIIGDIEQADIRNSGFGEVYDMFNDEESKEQGIHTFEFTSEDIMRSGLCRYIVMKFGQARKN